MEPRLFHHQSPPSRAISLHEQPLREEVEVVVNVRIAEGNELPKGWNPGMPLSVGTKKQLYAAPDNGCPFGEQCYSCRNGLTWNPARGKHTGSIQRGSINRRASRGRMIPSGVFSDRG